MGVSFFFDAKGEKVNAYPNPSVSHEWVRDAYNRCVLPLVLQALGMELLHASAILTSCGVFAFCANSGTGKSTLAYGLGQRGYDVWADDALAFTSSEADAVIRCHHLPFNIRLWNDSIENFASHSLNALSPTEFYPMKHRSVELEPLKAIFILRRVSNMKGWRCVNLKRLPFGESFSTALSHAYCFSLQDIERKKMMLQNHLDLSSRVPVLELQYRDGFVFLPQVLDELEPYFEEVFSDAGCTEQASTLLR